MTSHTESRFLRNVLLVDGLGAAVASPILLFGAGALAPLLGLPSGLLTLIGAVLGLIALGILWLTRQPRMSRRAVWAVIILNAIWVIDSILLLASGYFSPTRSGQVFVLAQAVVVAVIAELEFIGLRRQPALAAG